MTARLKFALMALAASLGSRSTPGVARPATSAGACLPHAPEAATRSGLAVDTIVRVMTAESHGNSIAVSPKGAMGCMQIMRVTWAYLSKRYELGADPFDARMNMIGGALYLAELTRQFGLPGAYAAYNAGPGRYLRFAANGTPLPAETVAYATRLGGAVAPAIADRPRARWQEAGLFLARGSLQREAGGDTAAPALPVVEHATAPSTRATMPHHAETMATLFPFTMPTARNKQ